ncbi:hypothetical protein [Caulobacter sp. FWC2]|uniref:hypothetical protein n=1 Tax=Caulobacter sp. FWC2 TaxID=69664 RepID=UPI000C145D95|nr:hypothetical protein [Caulobacter sp. FWC2]PIB93227.1 hypothetical protein CSW62_17540 [Caulobacter sp. FWC2]
MARTTEEAIEQLIATVKEALEDGRASASELEEWLLAAIMLEEMGLDEQCDARDVRTLSRWMLTGATLH